MDSGWAGLRRRPAAVAASVTVTHVTVTEPLHAGIIIDIARGHVLGPP